LLSRDFVQLVVWSLIIALPIAWYATTQWLQQFMFRFQPQWWLYIAGGLGVVLQAVFVVGMQALRAAKANPADSLRNE
jgi:putative ABC transport system permease protein